MRNPMVPCLLFLFAIISSGASYTQENTIAGYSSRWPVDIMHDPDYVRTDHLSMLHEAVLDLSCSKVRPTLTASLYGYKGNGLERIADIGRPAYFLIMTMDGQASRFPMVIRYDATAGDWALSNGLPPDFLKMLVPGSALVLENAEFDQILVFDLEGFENFRRAAARVCAIPISTSPASTTAPKRTLSPRSAVSAE